MRRISVFRAIRSYATGFRGAIPICSGNFRQFATGSDAVDKNLKAAREAAREMQGRVKLQYKKDPELAKSLAKASCVVPGFAEPISDQSPHCFVARQPMHNKEGESHIMGLAPSTGGNENYGCSADMVLQALLGCTGTTLRAVASARGAMFDRCVIEAEGDYDARGTLGVDKATPVGMTGVRLQYRFEVGRSVAAGHVLGSADWEKVLATTEKYCVVAQTLAGGLAGGIETSYVIDHSAADEA